MTFERLDKILSHRGFGSRKDVKRFCHDRIVFVNGKIVTDPSAKLDIDTDELVVDGERITLQRDIYIMMNKCQNVVCANKDGIHETVFDLVDDTLKHSFSARDLHCMGRLDIDTEGLLILTSDGALTHRLLSPKNHISKTYAVALRDSLSSEKKLEYVELFKNGFFIDREDKESEFTCQPSCLEFAENSFPNSSSKTDCLLTIYEGKFHQVKRMFAQLGNEVVYLKRVAMGGLKLDESLPLGKYRELTADEVEILAGN